MVSSLGGLAGCDALLSSPGGDFKVTIETPMPLAVSQRVAPVEVVFAVTGCNDFTATVGTATTAGSTARVIEPQRRPDGLYTATLPVDVLAEGSDCRADASRPSSLYTRLTISCTNERREAVADATISYATSFKSHYSGRGPVDTVLPGPVPGTLFSVGSGWFSYYDSEARGDAVTAVEPGIQPRLVQRGGNVYLWSGCPLTSCLMDLPDSPVKIRVSASYLTPFSFEAATGELGRAFGPIPVPGGVVDMTVLPAGTIAMVSQTSSSVQLAFVNRDDVLTRVQNFDGEATPTEIAQRNGVAVFLTTARSGSVAHLRNADGTPLGDYPLEGAGPVTYLSLAPSGDQYVYARSGEVRLGSIAADGTPLPTRRLETQLRTDSRFGAAWLTSQIGLWSSADGQTPELHARSGGGAPLKVAFTRDGRPTSVRRGLALDHAFVIVTPSGVEMFDESGLSAGGADPFASSCGRAGFQGHEVSVLDGETIAVGGTAQVSLFRPNAL